MKRNAKPRAAGRPREEKEPVRIVTLRLPVSLINELDQVAEGDGRSRANMCLEIVKAGVRARAPSDAASV